MEKIMKDDDLEEDKFVAGKCPDCGTPVAKKKDQPAEFCVDCKIKFGIPIKNN